MGGGDLCTLALYFQQRHYAFPRVVLFVCHKNYTEDFIKLGQMKENWPLHSSPAPDKGANPQVLHSKHSIL